MHIPKPPAGPMRAALVRMRLLMIAAGICGIAALALAPPAIESGWLLLVQDDPVALADRKLARSFNSEAATREIEAALGRRRRRTGEKLCRTGARPQCCARARTHRQGRCRGRRRRRGALKTAENFTRGLIVGEPDDLVSLAGTALGDLFVFGDIRDAVREGSRFALGQEVDHLILGLVGGRHCGDRRHLCLARHRRPRAGGPVAGQSRAQDRTHLRAHGGIGRRVRCARWSMEQRCARRSTAHR